MVDVPYGWIAGENGLEPDPEFWGSTRWKRIETSFGTFWVIDNDSGNTPSG